MLSILRIAAAFLFMPNGTLKLFNYPPPHPMPHLPPLMLVAGILECFGGLLLLLGVFARPVGIYPLGRDGDRVFHGVRTTWFLARS